ncbi:MULTISPECIES: NAD+ synthase [unclassified Parafrankia]|uniref:NAD+ synthase n=1 Tax=unclassified Parafrankia TaxID=2994368 RepID=UPI000DA5DDF3|nr:MULTISPECIES: NAD+ synthase [unclassified Parafrankia]TCJ33561.1 NAD+ synthase [Parafrankia sp. BMG5.11]CAI7978246.1 Glutamine-dependent NAD(+) synthetase [Frankia sp. Hr75.2]SQD96974.1 putative glutamine-dependent NAD(+) synthetase [Parafrankia sp. Ea1.12]
MAQLRIALAQVDTTVGDLDGNAELVSSWTKQALARSAHLVVFGEMTLTGYPAEDLVLRRSFVAASAAALERLAVRLAEEGAGEIAVVVGYLDASPTPAPAVGRPAGEPQNCVAVLWQGRVAARSAKHHLPNYGVFDEFRYFVPGTTFPVFRLHGVDVGLTVCEDLWQEGGPVAVAREVGVGLLLCINGSPYEQGKSYHRDELCARRAREAGATLAYVNLVGGQDELVFDGDSLVVDAGGEVLARAPVFAETLLTVDLDLPEGAGTGVGPETGPDGPVDAGDGTTMAVSRVVLAADPLPAWEPRPATVADRPDPAGELYAAVVTGTRDYVRKNGFRSVALGLSGGIDSALVATIAVDALGPDAVHTVAMPSAHSSQGSLDDAAELARRQRTRHSVVPIEPTVAAFHAALAAAGGLHGLAAENLQARVRGTLLMALSNEHGHLVLTTGNKSELATGFSTLYGDSAGGFAPIKDVSKTNVWALARWRNARAVARGEVPPIPEEIIVKPPSAELAPGQLDSDRLPDYSVLDAVLDDYVSHDLGRAELTAAGHAPATVDRVIRLVDLAEYKRRQNPPGPKVTSKAFGRDRRLPITSRWRERDHSAG